MPIPPSIAPGSATFARVRFSFTTPRSVRLEYAPDGVFADAPTLTCSSRPLVAEPPQVRKDGDAWIISAGSLTIIWRDDGGPLSAGNCRVDFSCGSMAGTWRPGQKDEGNLHGPRRTLDSYHGRMLYDKQLKELVVQPEPDGLLSRSGWALVDDSTAPLLQPGRDGRPWPVARPADGRQDWHLLCHGRDLRQGLADAAAVFGAMPLPPRFTLGLWISRWWAYTDEELLSLVDEYDRHGTGLDVLVLDMEWHTEGWGGTDWERAFFPSHKEFLAAVQARGLKITCNLHPADGVTRDQSAFAAMAAATGTPPVAEKVPFDCTDPRYMQGYFANLLHPNEDAGVRFWWLDWQQGTESAVPGLDPLPWLNHLHWQDQSARAQAKSARRPLNFSRYGGIGSGRYPIGFSGDTESSWRTLAYLVDFTAQSANCLYGHWSHDVGGFFESPWEKRLGAELYLRWVQFAAHAPVLRTHAARIAHADRRFWLWGEPYGGHMVAAVRRRYELAAYIYTANRRACDTAVSAVHGVYLDHPTHEGAYRAGQYALGDDLVVAPVVAAADPATGLARSETWLPPGAWYDTARGRQIPGGGLHSEGYLLDEVPVFARCGSVVPVFLDARRLAVRAVAHLGFECIPGATGGGEYYEDDGETQGYLHGDSAAWTVLQECGPDYVIIQLAALAGGYPGMPSRRRIDLRLCGLGPPQTVLLDGRALPSGDPSSSSGWSFDVQRMLPVIRLGDHDPRWPCTVEVRWRNAAALRAGDGLAGAVRRCRAAFHHLRAAIHPLMRRPADLAHVGARLAGGSDAVAERDALVRGIDDLLAACRRALEQPDGEDRRAAEQRAAATAAVALLADGLACLR